ncbi:MAG: ion transporter [Bacteroidaceae bacterium]|nr:ion transporter [Bacteroidaceae bacterium]
MKTQTENLKKKLARVFDNDLRTEQWQNWGDYIIIGFIIISTASIFISTFNVSPLCEKVLSIIDIVTVIVFTVEVSLRIWCADEISPRYRGVWGRVKYCFTFYGIIDILSTYTFYVAIFLPLPYAMFKSLRVLRLIRIFRYLHSFKLLKEAFSSKGNELLVSLQFLVIVTLMLSFVLYFYEHNAQPEVYNNGFKSVLWAFTQYIGDPGGFADTPPVTFAGRLIACIIGLLGIALFAVPAGLVGAGFSEAMEEEKQRKKIEKNISSIIHTFKFEKDQHHTNLFVVPRYKTVNLISARKLMPVADIFEAVKESGSLHLYDMASSMNAADYPESNLVVINCKRNTPYGCCIDRGSRVTIVSTSGNSEPSTSWFAYHIAKLGGFNFVAKEVETDLDNPTSYYNITESSKCPNLKLFLDDISRLADRPDSWVIPILGAIGLKSRPTQFHFCYNSTRGDSSYNDPQSTVKDYDTFDGLYNALSKVLSEKYSHRCDKNEWYAIIKDNVCRVIKANNVFTLRVECFVWMHDNNYMSVIKDVAETIHTTVEPERKLSVPQEMLKRPEGKDFGMEDYVD